MAAPASAYDTNENDFLGAQQRSRPGEGVNEKAPATTTDAFGRKVTDKPANRAIIAAQKARLERNETAQQKAERHSAERYGQAGIGSKLLLLAVFAPMLSFFMTGTYTFGLTPVVMPYLLEAWYHPMNPWGPKPLELSHLQLAEYDGSDPSKPIYISVAGTVFDVSANPRVYGKGGAYNMMAGRDASRAFVTGCFQTHLTHDLRGLPEEDLASLARWHDFFRTSDKYFPVGRVILPPIDRNSPIPPPCNLGDEAGGRHGAGAKPQGGAHSS